MAESAPEPSPDARRLLARRRRWRASKITAAVVAALLVGLARWTAPPGDFSRFHQKRFTVLAVPTADVVRVDAGGEAIDVHLLGVGAGPADRVFTVAGETVLLYLERIPTRTAGGELLAYVFLEDGSLLNEQRVATGQAFVDRRYDFTYRRTFEQTEEAAIAKGAGVWAALEEGKDPPMPQWRRRWRTEMSKPPWERGEWRLPGEP